MILKLSELIAILARDQIRTQTQELAQLHKRRSELFQDTTQLWRRRYERFFSNEIQTLFEQYGPYMLKPSNILYLLNYAHHAPLFRFSRSVDL